MSDNIIYTYGGGHALSMVLNGVAMIFQNGVAGYIISLMTTMAVSWAAILGIMQQSFLPKLNWALKYFLITTLLITPRGTVWVTDVVDGSRHKVDNLPVGLILPASLISTLGYGITTSFEQAFNEVDNISYSKYGTAFGASLISQARNYKIQDAVFRENMEGFIDNCVLYDAMIGRKYTVGDLRSSSDIWQLVGQNASNIKMFNYRDTSRQLITCSEGVKRLSNYFAEDINILSDRFKTPNKFLANTLINSMDIAGKFYRTDAPATNTIKQLMLINALNDMPASYGVVRAKHQQYEAWKLTGDLAKENMPIMHAVFAGLIYASFCLILGLLVMPNGFRVFGSYLGLLCWIELWPPLFAVLNLIVNLSSKAASNMDFTMDNISQIVSVQGNISSLAGYLMASIPFISYAIIKGGAGHFVHLAGQLTGATQGVASSIAQEVATGNQSFDNRSIANSQWYNNGGFKTDLNASMRMGHQDHQQPDGTVVKEGMDGHTIFQAGPGLTTSVGSKSINMNSAATSGLHQSLGSERSLMESKQTEYSELQQSMQRKASEFVSRLASGESSGEHYNYGQHSSDSKILSDVVDNTKELNERYGYGWTQSAEIGLSGGLHLKRGSSSSRSAPAIEESKPEGLLSTIVGGIAGMAGGEVGVNAGLNRKSSDDQSYTEQKGVMLRKGYTENVEAVARSAKETQFNTNQSEEKALAESLVGSYEKMQQVRESISVHQQNVDRYQSSIEQSQSQSLNTSDDLYHKELNFIAGQKDQHGFAYGQQRAQKMMEEGGGELHNDFMSKHIRHQSMPNFDHSYQQRAAGIVKPLTDEISQVRDVAHTGLSDVSAGAKQRVEAELSTSNTDHRFERDNHLSRGQALQHKVNEEEDARYSRGIIGKKRNEEEKLED